ncbi:MAG: hypothetical protein AB1650_02930 [Candidatus Omnitrophota bacterium]
MANQIDQETLLKDRRVLAEIDRHLWIESEKAGKDIGFEQAKADWIERFSKAWMSYHMPEIILKLVAEKKGLNNSPKRRSAKSYFK